MMNPNSLDNANVYFSAGMDSSYSATEGSEDDSSGDQDGDDRAQRRPSTENNMCNISQPPREYNANTTSNGQLHDPEVGMSFHSEEKAYEFYNTYAMRKGFSVRKGHLGRRKDGSVRDRIYLCSSEGTRQKHCSHNTKKPRPVLRTNCMARIEFKVTREHVWIVNKVIHEHNHPLLRPSKAHLLRSHRKMISTQQGGETEIPTEPNDIQTEQAIEAERVECLQSIRMRELEKGDIQVLLNFLKTRQLEDPSFYYAIQIDDKEHVTNVFWADPRSTIDYAYFGDVVLFDTTYQTSKNELPIALFIGINHHKQAVVFGAALLLDETKESFVWLFRTFLSAMSGKPPRTIFTDNCDAIFSAIGTAFPETCHKLCLWHILQTASRHVSHLYSCESNFQKDFRNCIYEGSYEKEFLTRWVDLVNKYDLLSNSYLEELYASREKWALIFYKDIFCASMTTIQWSDNLKKHFKKHFNRKSPLPKFIEQYHNALIQFRKKELYEDYRSRQTKPVLFVDMPMLNEAAESYTRLIYKEFEDGFKSQLSCLCEPVALDGTTLTFKVTYPQNGCYGLVEFDHTNCTVTCSCKKFESIGILCMHALKVLNTNNVLHFPPHYMLKRWTKYANDDITSNRYQVIDTDSGEENLKSRFSRVCHKAITIAAKSALSKDALDIFDNELSKMMTQVDVILCKAPVDKEGGDADIVDAPDTWKRKRGHKASLDKRQKHKSQDVQDLAMHQHPLQRHNNDASAGIMIEETSSIPTFGQDGAVAYNRSIPMPACFPSETVITSQESFPASQSLFDNTMTSQGMVSPNLSWFASRGSINVPTPVMQGQANNFLNWRLESHIIPNTPLAQSQLEQVMQSSVHQQDLSHKLKFDINKGS